MGLLDKIRGEFIDIIEWTDSSGDTMVYRFDRRDNEIKMDAKMIRFMAYNLFPHALQKLASGSCEA
jgi:membrane protease subunit (stomatin/prohibitin family)